MIKNHTETSTEPTALVDGGKVQATLPTSLDKAHQEELDKKSRTLAPADVFAMMVPYRGLIRI